MKKINKTLSVLSACLITILTAGHSFAQSDLTPPPGAIAPALELRHKAIPVEKISAGLFRLGDIQISKKDRSISFPALVNMDKGLLEYLLVQTGGKIHESLFRTKVQPYDLQLAFLLLGFEGTDKPLSAQGAPERPKGEPLEIMVTYSKADGKSITIRPEEWIVTRIMGGKENNVSSLEWVFTGSITMDGAFLAQRDGSIVAIYHDPVALVDNASPGGESDENWFVKEGSTPSVGTPVTINIKAKK